MDVNDHPTLLAAPLAAWLDEATRLVHEASALAREKLQAGFTHQVKADSTFVTEVDLAIEQRLRAELGRLFPAHGILGEEFGDDQREVPWRWVIDPIDGTYSLRHRIPLFGVLLALEFQERPVLGVVGLPGLDRVYRAARGLGTYLGDQRIVLGDLASDGEIDGQVLAIGDRSQFVNRGKQSVFDAVWGLDRVVVRTYPDAFGHALTVQGCAGAMLDPGVRRWDYAATQVLIEEAGGRFEILGTVQDRGEPRYDLLFGKPRLVQWLLDRLDGLR